MDVSIHGLQMGGWVYGWKGVGMGVYIMHASLGICTDSWVDGRVGTIMAVRCVGGCMNG